MDCVSIQNFTVVITELRTTDTKLPEMEPEVLASVVEFRDGMKSKNLIGKRFQFDDRLSESFLK